MPSRKQILISYQLISYQLLISQGVTVIVTTHFMEEAEYCDRMLIMSHGAELAQGIPADIRRLAQSDDNPEPTVEDAFIALAEGRVQPDSLRAAQGERQ